MGLKVHSQAPKKSVYLPLHFLSSFTMINDGNPTNTWMIVSARSLRCTSWRAYWRCAMLLRWSHPADGQLNQPTYLLSILKSKCLSWLGLPQRDCGLHIYTATRSRITWRSLLSSTSTRWDLWCLQVRCYFNFLLRLRISQRSLDIIAELRPGLAKLFGSLGPQASALNFSVSAGITSSRPVSG